MLNDRIFPSADRASNIFRILMRPAILLLVALLAVVCPAASAVAGTPVTTPVGGASSGTIDDRSAGAGKYSLNSTVDEARARSVKLQVTVTSSSALLRKGSSGAIMTVAPASGRPTIQTQVIGSFNGRQWTIPTAINNSGLIVGYAMPTGTTAGVDAFIWTERAGFQLLAKDAIATDVNERGDVSGYRFECTAFPWGSSCIQRGFIWTERSGFIDLGDLAPMAINARGDVAGDCPTTDTLAACAIIGGVRTEWVCEVTDCGQRATGINEGGDVVGYRFSPDGSEAMLFPRNGTPVILGAQTAEDINNARTVAGRAPSSLWPSNATLWTTRGMIQAPSASTTVASSVNSRGVAAGVRFGEEGGTTAFYWDGTSEGVVFLAPDATYSEATDINDGGRVVGYVSTSNLRWELVVWTVR